jgi:hypothetical protein
MINAEQLLPCDISGSHGGKYEYHSLRAHSTMGRTTPCKNLQTQLAWLSVPGNGSLPMVKWSGRGVFLTVVKAAPLGESDPIQNHFPSSLKAESLGQLPRTRKHA